MNLKRKNMAALDKAQPETTTLSSSRHLYALVQTQNTQNQTQTQNHQQPPKPLIVALLSQDEVKDGIMSARI